MRFNQCARINCIELLINDDDIAENEERLLISMEIENSSSNGLVPVANKQILTIIDDDGILKHYTHFSTIITKLCVSILY